MVTEIVRSQASLRADLETFQRRSLPDGVFSDLDTTIVHRFGLNEAAATAMEPICGGGLWPTLQPAGAVALRVKAGGNAADTAAGAGAREVTIVGIDETGALVSEAVATAGASASDPTTATFIRILDAYVSASGSYATIAGGSHTAAITIEDGGGAADWATISATGFAKGQTQIGCYTIPLGKTGWVNNASIRIEDSGVADVMMFKREGILDAAAPYSALLAIDEMLDAFGTVDIGGDFWLGPFPALTDIGFMALHASSAAKVAVKFEVMLVDAS